MHPTQSPWAMSENAGQAHIVVLEYTLNECGTSSSTCSHVGPLTRTWRVNKGFLIEESQSKNVLLRNKQRGN